MKEEGSFFDEMRAKSDAVHTSYANRKREKETADALFISLIKERYYDAFLQELKDALRLDTPKRALLGRRVLFDLDTDGCSMLLRLYDSLDAAAPFGHAELSIDDHPSCESGCPRRGERLKYAVLVWLADDMGEFGLEPCGDKAGYYELSWQSKKQKT